MEHQALADTDLCGGQPDQSGERPVRRLRRRPFRRLHQDWARVLHRHPPEVLTPIGPRFSGVIAAVLPGSVAIFFGRSPNERTRNASKCTSTAALFCNSAHSLSAAAAACAAPFRSTRSYRPIPPTLRSAL